MTLKEKFQEEPVVVYQESFILTNQSAERLVELADDYAIEFAEWVIDTDDKPVGQFTITELLEIFKKEKGYE